MNNAGRIVCLMVLFITTTPCIFAQNPPTPSTTLNYLRVTGLFAKNDQTGGESETENDWRWVIEVNGAPDDIHRCENLIMFSKTAHTGWFFPGDGVSPSLPYNLLPPYNTPPSKFPGNNPLFIADITNTNQSEFQLGMHAWESDGCDADCEYNRCSGPFGIPGNSDDGECPFGTNNLAIRDYEPGMNNTVVLNYCTTAPNHDPYAAQYEFSYNPPKPQISIQAQPQPVGLICDVNPTIVLAASSFINPNFKSRVEFLWDYSLDGVNWNPIVNPFNGAPVTTFNEDPLSFWWIRSLPNLVNNITVNTSVFFKVTTRYWASDGGAYLSDASNNIISVQLSPVAPTIDSFSPTVSCPNKGSGTVEVHVSGLGDYMYALRPQTDVPGNCIPNPNIVGPQCGSPTHRAGNTFTFENIVSDTYLLAVFNRGNDGVNDAGVCFTTTLVTIGKIDVLKIQPPAVTPVTCHGGSDGIVKLTSTGGIAPWTYSLTGSPDNDTGEFTSLIAGNYTGSVTDGCQQSIPDAPTTSPVVMTEPLNILATLNPTSPSCNTPPNGSVLVNITQGEGTYSFSLLKYGKSISELNSAKVNSWAVNSLDSGNYLLEIKDADRLQCEGLSLPATLIVAPAFSIDGNTIVTQNVSCFGRNDGEIKLNIPSSNSFVYTISGGGMQATSGTPNFPSLSAASYSMVMERNVGVCNEHFFFPTPIEITQPDEIIINPEKHDISCFEEVDGKIIIHLQGATNTDRYAWETKIGGNWATLSNTTTTLENLIAGLYHFKLSNDNGCSAESDDIEIIEPAKLIIDQVTIRDTKCLGDLAEIETTLTGGVKPYAYTYASSDTTIQSSTAITSFRKGTYSLHVADVNGCRADYGNTLTITTPDIPLVFISLLSDYSGFNVSCAGVSDAWASFQAWGGNGGGYFGYEYGIDGRYQEAEKIENIAVGAHTLSVRDERGCIVTHDVNITAPANKLNPNLITKSNVRCLGDTTGQFSLYATGGLIPYTFQLLDHDVQQSGVFSNLAPGSYTIIIKDKNGCTTQFTDEITILTPPIKAIENITNVSCYGGSDGAIQIDLAGGTPPLQYVWGKGLGTSLSLKNLAHGDYVLTVTDQQGCKVSLTNTVKQPDSLVLHLATIPICIGKVNGELRAQATGGTKPFEYSIDKGNHYQDSSVFTNVAIGTYTVQVRDHNSCITSLQTSVGVSKDIPDLDFIVATKQNAQDTLIIKEISIPKPDSIEWTFDSGITVVNQDVWSPEVVVKEPGIYHISLKGYFGGCEYTKSLDINTDPYDPQRHQGATIPTEVIKTVSVNPNPSNGTFTVVVDLNLKQHVSIKIFDLLGVSHLSKTWDDTLHVEENVNFSSGPVAQGIYVVQVVTDTDAQEVKMLINP